MPVSLTKGGNVSLTKLAPGLRRVRLGLGWDVRDSRGADFDLDASVFLLGPGEKVRGDNDFIFYNQPRSADGAVEHTGDNRTGTGEGDDESVRVDLESLSPEITKLVVAVTIHEAQRRWQHFGLVKAAYIRVLDDGGDAGTELARFDLSADGGMEIAMVFGEIYRAGGEWKFRAVGQGFRGGLGPMAEFYGVQTRP